MRYIKIDASNNDPEIQEIMESLKQNDIALTKELLMNFLTIVDVMTPLVIGVIGCRYFNQPISFFIGGGVSVIVFCVDYAVRNFKQSTDEVSRIAKEISMENKAQKNRVDFTRLRKMNNQKN